MGRGPAIANSNIPLKRVVSVDQNPSVEINQQNVAPPDPVVPPEPPVVPPVREAAPSSSVKTEAEKRREFHLKNK